MPSGVNEKHKAPVAKPGGDLETKGGDKPAPKGGEAAVAKADARVTKGGAKGAGVQRRAVVDACVAPSSARRANHLLLCHAPFLKWREIWI